MPVYRAQISDDREWFLSPNKVIIPIDTIRNMTPEEIGTQVIQLAERLKALLPYWVDWAPMEFIDDFEQWVSRRADLERKAQEEEEKQRHKKDTRVEISAKYERTFLRIARRDGFMCQQCKDAKELELDHIVPVSKGGTNALSNLQLLCQACNREKRGK